jgi:hypothetical protein
MLGRIVVAAVALGSVLPLQAAELTAEEARRFVIGKTFAFNCFEGTRGAGRVLNDGSVAGSIQFRGNGPTHFVRMPPGTLKVKGESVCASVKGMFFEPCFNLDRRDQQNFRGSVSGLGFAYCDFTRRGGRAEMAGASTPPQPIQSAEASPRSE